MSDFSVVGESRTRARTHGRRSDLFIDPAVAGTRRLCRCVRRAARRDHGGRPRLHRSRACGLPASSLPLVPGGRMRVTCPHTRAAHTRTRARADAHTGASTHGRVQWTQARNPLTHAPTHAHTRAHRHTGRDTLSLFSPPLPSRPLPSPLPPPPSPPLSSNAILLPHTTGALTDMTASPEGIFFGSSPAAFTTDLPFDFPISSFLNDLQA